MLTHRLLPTCCSEPPEVKLNWCPPHDEYKPSVTPSTADPIGCTQYPLKVCLRFPFSKTNSRLWNKDELLKLVLTNIKFRKKYLEKWSLYIFLGTLRQLGQVTCHVTFITLSCWKYNVKSFVHTSFLLITFICFRFLFTLTLSVFFSLRSAGHSSRWV